MNMQDSTVGIEQSTLQKLEKTESVLAQRKRSPCCLSYSIPQGPKHHPESLLSFSPRVRRRGGGGEGERRGRM